MTADMRLRRHPTRHPAGPALAAMMCASAVAASPADQFAADFRDGVARCVAAILDQSALEPGEWTRRRTDDGVGMRSYWKLRDVGLVLMTQRSSSQANRECLVTHSAHRVPVDWVSAAVAAVEDWVAATYPSLDGAQFDTSAVSTLRRYSNPSWDMELPDRTARGCIARIEFLAVRVPLWLDREPNVSFWVREKLSTPCPSLPETWVEP